MFDANDQKVLQTMIEKAIATQLDTKITKLENRLLEEMECAEKNLERKIQSAENNFCIAILEQTNTFLCLRTLSDLEKRLETLEQQTA